MRCRVPGLASAAPPTDRQTDLRAKNTALHATEPGERRWGRRCHVTTGTSRAERCRGWCRRRFKGRRTGRGRAGKQRVVGTEGPPQQVWADLAGRPELTRPASRPVGPAAAHASANEVVVGRPACLPPRRLRRRLHSQLGRAAVEAAAWRRRRSQPTAVMRPRST